LSQVTFGYSKYVFVSYCRRQITSLGCICQATACRSDSAAFGCGCQCFLQCGLSCKKFSLFYQSSALFAHNIGSCCSSCSGVVTCCGRAAQAELGVLGRWAQRQHSIPVFLTAEPLQTMNAGRHARQQNHQLCRQLPGSMQLARTTLQTASSCASGQVPLQAQLLLSCLCYTANLSHLATRCTKLLRQLYLCWCTQRCDSSICLLCSAAAPRRSLLRAIQVEQYAASSSSRAAGTKRRSDQWESPSNRVASCCWSLMPDTPLLRFVLQTAGTRR
jgi:hypothetical protein